MTAGVKKETADQFRVEFAALARAKHVQIDPYLIAQAIAVVMRECGVRSALGRPLVWNEYRVVLARTDFDAIRPLQAPLERDLRIVLAQEAHARQAELVGELRVTVVFDEADELRAGEGVVRVAFVSTERLSAPKAGELTMRFDGFAVAGEIVAKAPSPTDTMHVTDSVIGPAAQLRWAGGSAAVPHGATYVLGRAHPDAPPQFVPISGAPATINKQHCWIAATPGSVRIGRFDKANPVHVNGQALDAGGELEVALPCEVSLSRGDMIVFVEPDPKVR